MDDVLIQAMRRAAAESGDIVRLVVCDHALGQDVVVHGPTADAEIVRAMGMTRSQARHECTKLAALDAEAGR